MQKYSRQDSALRKYAQDKNIEYVISLKEDASGKNFTDRPEWNRLERLLHPGDTVVFKDISRFTREAQNGYEKYMELMNKGIELIFIDNPTVSTPYIQKLLDVAEEQSLVAKTSLESTVKLLLIVELDRAEQERRILIERIRNGIEASKKSQGRKKGALDKMTDSLHQDIELYLTDRNVKQSDLMKKHDISRNTLKKYIEIVKLEEENGRRQ